MSFRIRAMALPSIALGLLVGFGCGPTNEEELKGKSEVVPHKEGTPDFKSYSEAMTHQSQQYSKNQGKAAAKKAPEKAK
jgi:hypothetical protein